MSWLTRFGSWLCSDCSKPNGPSIASDGAQLPTPELSSLSRSVSQSSSLPTSKYPRCVTCKKTLLKGSMGSMQCKSCGIKNKHDRAVKARLAEVKSEKICIQRSKIPKSLFRKNFRTKIRTEKIRRPFTIVHNYMVPTSPLDSGRLSESREKRQANIPSRKRKHGKSLITVGPMD
jgi:hypothetical protein